MKKFWKILIIVLLVLLVLAGGYVAYVFLYYHRIPTTRRSTSTSRSRSPSPRPGRITAY